VGSKGRKIPITPRAKNRNPKTIKIGLPIFFRILLSLLQQIAVLKYVFMYA
jgi:hypothetical protein